MMKALEMAKAGPLDPKSICLTAPNVVVMDEDDRTKSKQDRGMLIGIDWELTNP